MHKFRKFIGCIALNIGTTQYTLYKLPIICSLLTVVRTCTHARTYIGERTHIPHRFIYDEL